MRLLALAVLAACVVAFPLAVASAGQVADAGRSAVHATSHDAVRDAAPGATAEAGRDAVGDAAEGDDKGSAAGSPSSPLLLGLGLATAARCGPELSSRDGVEAQTCRLTEGEDTWARTYYRNATGGPLDAVLSLMGPGGRTLQMRCVVGAGEEPGTCETPKGRTLGGLERYTAVAEFAARAGRGPLLLRSGSNSGTTAGS